MIKKIIVCECDICGERVPAKHVAGRYNEPEYTKPNGWITGANSEVLICPECAKRLKTAGRTGNEKEPD